MEKREKLLFSKVFFIIILIGLLEVGFFFYKYVPKNNLTGMSVQENVMGAYDGMSNLSKLFLIVQWSLLLLFLMFAYVRDGNVLVKDRQVTEQDLREVSLGLKNSDTNLDALYSLLQKRKTLRLSTIAKVFHVNKDLADEWARILESGDLAVIEKNSGEIVLRIKER